MALTQPQLAKLTDQLDQRYASLLERVRDELGNSENPQYVELLDRVHVDVGDQSVADALADVNLAMVDRHVQELRDIEAAKARMTERTFGSCIACGDEIRFERLLAYPTAKRCLTCQTLHEKTFAHTPTPTL